MTRDQQRCLRSVFSKLAGIQQEILWCALDGEISAVRKAEMVEELRKAADQLERGND